MIATSPEALHQLWVDGVNRGDLDGLSDLYEAEAAFVVSPGQIVTGLPAVREATAGLLALNPRATLEIKTVIRSGGLAVLLSTWHLTGTDASGSPVDVGGQTADVARRQDDGSWRFAIDNPWGDAAVGA
jgi:uncharacterized protein (TIGR02246 family)